MSTLQYGRVADNSSPKNEAGFFLTVAKKKIETSAELCNNSVLKRTMDLLISLLVFLFIFSWLFPLIAFLIKLTSKGPVFYVQHRKGLQGDIINVYKFRTMVVDAPMLDASGKFLQALKNDTRITPIGKILRKTSLDELPQFLNVLEGNMSIIGPRPHVEHLDNHYDESIPNYDMRTLVKPGITGLAQAKGFRGVTHGPNDMENRVQMDLLYIKKWSIALDIKIFFMTIYSIVAGDENAF